VSGPTVVWAGGPLAARGSADWRGEHRPRGAAKP